MGIRTLQGRLHFQVLRPVASWAPLITQQAPVVLSLPADERLKLVTLLGSEDKLVDADRLCKGSFIGFEGQRRSALWRFRRPFRDGKVSERYPLPAPLKRMRKTKSMGFRSFGRLYRLPKQFPKSGDFAWLRDCFVAC